MVSPTDTPALLPPPGEVYDSTAPNALWKWNVICQTICLVFPSILFILRTYIRAWIKRVWVLEDFLCCFAYTGLVVYLGLLTTIIYKGGGIHEWNLTEPQVVEILYYLNLIQILYSPAAAFTKSAILVLYLRIFSPYRWSKFNITIRAFILVIGLFYIAITIAKICQCLPRARIWDKSVPGQCMDLVTLLDASGLFNIVSDFGILLIPLKGIWSLQLSRKRKVAVYAVFTVGAIAPAFSTIGFIKRFALGSSPDKSYNQVVILLWAAAELAVGMMIICFPTLPGIVHSRIKKPSLSIVNGSARSNSTRPYLQRGARDTDEHNTLVDREYLELCYVSHYQDWLKSSATTVVNEISRSDVREGDEICPNRGECMPADGILRTIRIEQSNV